MRPIQRLVVLALLALPAAWTPSAAFAQEAARSAPAKASKAPRKAPKKAPGDAKQTAALTQARQLMRSANRADVEAGIQSLGLLGGVAAVAPLEERIRHGLPPDLLEAAIVTLMALAQPEAGPVLFELTTHRRPEIRLRAIEALIATQAPGAEAALSTALSDSDARVRSAAATGLGELKATGSLERLFLALDRGNMEASFAIGRVMPPSDVKRIMGYLGQVPFRSLAPALAEVLKRKDVTDAAKLDVIARLEEVGTREVKSFLGDLVAGGDALPQPISRAALRAMQEIAE